MAFEQGRASESVYSADVGEKGGLTPFFFGPDDHSLFGCLYSPQSRQGRNWGAVLCYPTGHEYIISHRAFRQLAQRLTLAGFHVLRFDYFGSGDSGGESDEARIAGGLSDIAMAMQELRRRAGIEKLCVVGCRMGASLAMLEGAQHGNIGTLVLWDPIVSGAAYLDDLRGKHKRMLLSSHVRPPKAGDTGEILGSPLTDVMRQDLASLDLLSIARKPAATVLVVQSSEEQHALRLKMHLQDLGTDVSYRLVPTQMTWDWSELPTKVLVPAQIIQTIVTWLDTACV